MASLFEKYKPAIDEIIKQFKDLIKLYSDVLKKNPQDSDAEYKMDNLQIYLNKAEKDLKDMPNRDDEYEYYLNTMKYKLKKSQEEFDKKYNKSFTISESDAKAALQETTNTLKEIIKKLRTYNASYKQSKHRDNLPAVSLISEITDRINTLNAKFYDLSNKNTSDYDYFVRDLKEITARYNKKCELIVNNKFIAYSDKPHFDEPQPGDE